MITRRKKTTVRVVEYILILISLVVFLFPIFWMITTSLKNQVDAFTTVPKWFFHVTFANYYSVLVTNGFSNYLLQSLVIGVVSTVIAMALACGVAYPLAQYQLKANSRLLSWILSLRILPPIVMALPLYLLFEKLGMLNSMASLIITYVVMNLPLATLLLYGFFQDMPKELEESALVDGCTRFTSFVRVVLPITKPGLVASGLLSFIFAWNEFLFANVFSGPNLQTAPVALNTYTTPVSILWAQIAAAGTILVLPIVIITIFVQKHIVRGLTAGAVKG